ncbi:MAG: hypothetical protein HY718_19885 [Planctomycetes bacterium]|nr:hypothetical protein [Planctomycetota bacterium]
MRAEDEPYCRACGYSLRGLTDSSKCPECGRPIVEVLVRDSFPGARGRRYQSQRRLFGLPLVSIAVGPSGGERMGRPVGIIAIGDLPKGVIAIGGRALGVVAIGGFTMGVFSVGGFALGAAAVGGFSGGIIAGGGFAVGAYAVGGMVIAVLGGVGGQVFRLGF